MLTTPANAASDQLNLLSSDHDASTPASPDSELATYSYSYPHKSSYRRLDPPIPIHQVWAAEPRDNLALYVHIPFCEMRCGFCNLFTQSQPQADVVSAYLSSLSRQMSIVRDEVGPARIAQFAIGGGTPTILSVDEMQTLLDSVERNFQFTIAETPTSVEVSPATASAEKLQLLARFGVQRVSIGIQSFNDRDLGRIGRPQRVGDVRRSLELIRDLNFPILNIDLIYGDPEQSLDGWLESLRSALAYAPDEFYLYPLYVRPETGLGRQGRDAGHRSELYRAGRDLLCSEGYQQSSLRCFQKSRTSETTEYSCQSSGMIGLGCGARSYTQDLHYSTRFAVTQAGVRAILADWIQQTDQEFQLATHGIRLDESEHRRRFLILSLLQASGLKTSDYEERFGGSPLEHFDEIQTLTTQGWIEQTADRIVLTDLGLENSDLVGPLFYSASVRDRLREFTRS